MHRGVSCELRSIGPEQIRPILLPGLRSLNVRAPQGAILSATKAAIRSFARTWTTDLKDRRIRVNAVSPGPTETTAFNELLGSSGAEARKRITTSIPLGRLGTPDEIAKAVVFLASEDSSFITGIELFVDGGFAQI